MIQRVSGGAVRIHSRFVNWYLIEEGGELTAIDAGLPPDWDTLKEAARELGLTPADLRAVVLTHAHIDHTGFAERARQELGATVYVHEDERALMDRQLRMAKSERSPLLYAGNGATRRAIFSLLRTGAFRSRPVREYRTFEDGDVLPVPGSPRVVFTPGHTFGHAALHLPDRDVLFTGDALVTRNPYTGDARPQIVSRAATADSARALASLDRIEATGAHTLLTGHGNPWERGAAEAVREARAVGVT